MEKIDKIVKHEINFIIKHNDFYLSIHLDLQEKVDNDLKQEIDFIIKTINFQLSIK